MTFTRSNNKAVAAVQRLAADFATKIQELAHYLKDLVTSEAADWMERVREWTRWILEKAGKLCQKLALSVASERSSLANSSEMRAASAAEVSEVVLRAVQAAKQLTGNLIHDEDLYGDDLEHALELYDALEDVLDALGMPWSKADQVLEDAKAKLMEANARHAAGEEKNEDALASKKMRFE